MKFILLSMAVLFPIFVHAKPAQIVILRHAEEPNKGDELSAKGWERAESLPPLFEHDADLSLFGKPVALYAAAPDKKGGSIRSIQTLTPLSKFYGLKIKTKYTKEETQEIAQKVLSKSEYDGKTVVICWSHKFIGDLVHGFDSSTHLRWPDKAYDRFWILRFEGDRIIFIDREQ
jgi:hypothetical protein